MHLDGRLGPGGRGWHILCVPYPEWKLLHDASPVRPGHCDAQQVPALSLSIHEQGMHTTSGIETRDSVLEVAWGAHA